MNVFLIEQKTRWLGIQLELQYNLIKSGCQGALQASTVWKFDTSPLYHVFNGPPLQGLFYGNSSNIPEDSMTAG